MNEVSGIVNSSALRKERVFDITFTNVGFEGAVELIREQRGAGSFRYVVTPNVDHIVRLRDNKSLADVYAGAWLSLCDSKPISWLSRLLFCRLHLVTGSDLTARLFHSEIKAGDKVALIAPYAAVGEAMAKTFPGVDIAWHVPPEGVLNNRAAMVACAEFAARCRPDYLFIAVGSPQSELIAHEVSKMPGATGVGICCGASLEFIVGLKKRAPMVMQRFGIEWFHRLMSDPRRLWRRYVFAFGPLFGLFVQEAARRVRGRSGPAAETSSA